MEERKLSELRLGSGRRRKARTQRPGEREESSGGVGQIKEEVTKRGKTDDQGPEQCMGPE